jgi:DNA-directed RNA polymerase specialized sigma subunit
VTGSETKPRWIDMMRGRPPKKISWQDELVLIQRAQAGDRRAVDALILYYEDFAQQVAKKTAWFTGAHAEEEDLSQIARLCIFEKIKDYDFGYVAVASLVAGMQRMIDPAYPTYTPARLSSYAFREIRRRMMQHACKNLENVPGSSSSVGHAAHKELDRGVPAEEVAERFGLQIETVRALERHTVPLNEEVMNIADDQDVEGDYEFEQKRIDAKRYCWYALTAAQRLSLTLCVFEPDSKLRASIQDISLSDLDVLEAQAWRRWDVLYKSFNLEEEGR